MAKSFPKGGIHPVEYKFSAGMAIETLPLPKTVTIPVSQHIGSPAVPVVNKGDKVKVGTLIAKSSGFISVNIHSSVSGTVSKIEEITDASGYRKKSVIIDVEGDEWESSIDRSSVVDKQVNYDSEEIIKKVAESGIVGMGGATFPTHVKLAIPKGKKAEVLIINGAECEPYLTADHRLMLERGNEIIVGIKILMKALKTDKTLFGIESNKPDAINTMNRLAANSLGIDIVPLKVQYPQGGEKQLIKALIGREVPSGGLPIDVGTVVHNVGTTLAVYEAIQKNKPLIERVVTITGKNVRQPGNFLVRIGTPVSVLIEAIGGLPDDTGKIVSGGPMMGKALGSIDIPVTKGTSGILLLSKKDAVRAEMLNCIRCGNCVSVCPMGLEPYLFMQFSERSMWERMEQSKALDCIECGSCSFSCPSKRTLLDYIKLGKANIIRIKREKQK